MVQYLKTPKLRPPRGLLRGLFQLDLNRAPPLRVRELCTTLGLVATFGDPFILLRGWRTDINKALGSQSTLLDTLRTRAKTTQTRSMLRTVLCGPRFRRFPRLG